MPIKTLYKALAITTAVFAVTLVFYILLFKDIKSRNERAAEFVIETQLESVREFKLKALKTSVSDTEEMRRELETYIPPAETAINLVEEVEGLGTVSGAHIAIQRISREPYTIDQFEWLAFTISISGSWNQIMRTVAMIESFPYPIQTGALSLERSPAGEDFGWQARMTFKILKNK